MKKLNRTKQKLATIGILAYLFLSLLVRTINVQGQYTYDGTIATTELINWSSLSNTSLTNFVNLCVAQNISVFLARLNSYYYGGNTHGTDPGIYAAVHRLIPIANAAGVEVGIDLHTWHSTGSPSTNPATWDDGFDDSYSNHEAIRNAYLSYVQATINAFSSANVYSFMVLNEPQAQTASTEENNFILQVISTAQAATTRPIGVRFMGGYSPTTGHYAASIDAACDFVCRNTYWDARYPGTTVYGTTEAKLLAARDYAHTNDKHFWMTEFGYPKSDQENQRDFYEAFVAWARGHEFELITGWASQYGSTGETYNLFSGTTPLPAWYELVNPENLEPPSFEVNTVVLDTPANLQSFSSTTLTIDFKYTATFYEGAIKNSSVWANKTGTWQRLAWNSTVVTNATLHTISYTFPSPARYIWNVQAFNSTKAVWASNNRTIIIESALMPNVVVLNAPNNLQNFIYTALTIKFNYTATVYQGSIKNSSLWANKTGTWQRVAWNTTKVSNNTLHTISYTFEATGRYVWNIRVFNTTTSVAIWASSNRTLHIDDAPAVDDPPVAGTISVDTTKEGHTALFQCGWSDDNNLEYGFISHNASGSASITITQIAFTTQAPPPTTIPLNGWGVDSTLTNSTYVLNSNPSSLYLQLDATDINSRVTIYNVDVPELSLSDYAYINVSVSGTDNARIVLRFFLDDETSFDVVYWGSPATLNAIEFDLSPYAGRTLDQVYIGLMSATISYGTWVNRTLHSMFAPHTTFSDEITLPSPAGVILGYRFYANDSAGQWAVTAIYTLTTTGHVVYHFPADVTLTGGVTYHFGDEYFKTTSTFSTITAWFESNWINYTVASVGTQTIYNGSKPLYVLIDGTNTTENGGWAYSGGIVTVTSAASAVCISYASVSGPPSPEGPHGGGSSYQLTWIITLNGKMVDGASIALTDAAYGWYVAELSTVDGQASHSLASGTYNYTVTYKEYEVTGTLIHTSDETISVDLATKQVSVTSNWGSKIKLLIIAIAIIVAGVLIVNVVMKSGRKH